MAHEFEIVVSGVDHEAPDFEARFFEAGCDDATLAFLNGRLVFLFDREAPTRREAIASAIADIRRGGGTVKVPPT